MKNVKPQMINISGKGELSITFTSRTTSTASYAHGNINPMWWERTVGDGGL